MTDSSVRRRVFVIGLGFCPVRARIFRHDCRAPTIYTHRRCRVGLALGKYFFTISRQLPGMISTRYSFATQISPMRRSRTRVRFGSLSRDIANSLSLTEIAMKIPNYVCAQKNARDIYFFFFFFSGMQRNIGKHTCYK